MIHVVTHRNPFDRSVADQSIVPWDENATPSNLMPSWLRGRAGACCWRNGALVEEADMDRLCCDGDFLAYSLRPGGDPVTVTFLGAAVFTASAGVAAVAIAVGNAIIAAIVTRALAGSSSARKPALPGSEQESATYSFGGITSNPDSEGSALNVVFGEHRVAGTLLNVYTRSAAYPPSSTIYMLIALAGHECEQIGDQTADADGLSTALGTLPAGLEINNQPAENFQEVDVSVRMGTADQTAIPIHALPRTQYGVDQVLLVPNDPTTIELAPGAYAAGDAALEPWSSPSAYTMGETADEMISEIDFRQGLFALTSTGTRADATVEFQQRYTRVDDAGIRFGKTVVLPKFSGITARQGIPFSVEVVTPFIDPEDFTFGAASDLLSLDGVNDYATLAAPSGISTPTAATTKMTVLAWIQVEWTVAGAGNFASPFSFAPAGASMTIASQLSANAGFRFTLRDTGERISRRATWITPFHQRRWMFANGNIGVPESSVLQVTLGDGTATELFETPELGTDTTEFSAALLPQNPTTAGQVFGPLVLVGFTYDANADGAPLATLNAVKFFWGDGKQIGPTLYTANDHIWSGAAKINIGANESNGAVFGGNLEEVLLYQRALGAGDFSFRNNGGNGIPVTASELGLVVGWHFDAANPTHDIITGATNAVTFTNGATTTTGGLPVLGGTPLRAKYFVEMQRLSADNSATHYQDQATWSNVKLTTYTEFSHPGVALLGVSIKAHEQISGGVPLITIPVRGYKCPVWDGVDRVSPTLVPTWTRDPAWQLAAVVTDKVLGLGRLFPDARVDWPALKAMSDYDDDLVWDGRESEDGFGGMTSIGMSSVAAGGSWPTGQIEFNVADTDWQPGLPTTFGTTAVVAASDAFAWFGITNVDQINAPQWVKDIEDKIMPVGELFHLQVTPRWVVRCHAPVDPGTSVLYSPTTSGEDLVRAFEARMEFDGVFDRADEGAWDALLSIAKTARAAPTLRGAVFSVFQDRPRSPSAMVCAANTAPGSFEQRWSSIATRTNQFYVQFFNRDKGYGVDDVTIPHPSISDPGPGSKVPVIEEAIQVEGITRRSQIVRHVTQDLNLFHMSRRSVSFDVGPDALGVEPGDVLYASSELPQWGFSGRLGVSSPDGMRVYLDRIITIAAATSYEILVRDSSTGLTATAAIDEASTGVGTHLAGIPITLSESLPFAPRKGDVYAFGIVSRTHQKVLVVGSTFDPSEFTRSVLAIEYHESVYTPYEFGTYPSTPITALPAPTLDALPS